MTEMSMRERVFLFTLIFFILWLRILRWRILQGEAGGEFCPELTAARTRVWEVLRPYRMKLLRLAPAKFIHFGTTREILELMNGGVDEYHYLGWSRKVGSSIRSDVSGYNSVLSSRASVGKDCYLEVSYVHGNSRIGSYSVLSYIDVQDQVIPDNVVLHGLKQRNGKFIVRILA